MSALNPTHPDRLCDAQGRPYFLWDTDMTLEQFRVHLRAEDQATRAYAISKLMRQARPDDVFSFVTTDQIREDWSAIATQLGDKREFWLWVLSSWGVLGDSVG